MSAARASCLFCAAEGRVAHPEVRDVQQGLPGEWRILFCDACGLAWLDPRPSDNEIPSYYSPSAYYTHSSQRTPESRCVTALRGLAPGRVLDVGCGNGSDLARLQEMGWQPFGIEPDLRAAALAKEVPGAEVLQGTLADASLPNESFDAVIMNQVIEHLLDPVGALRECRRLLKPGGLLVVATPNWLSRGHEQFGASWFSMEAPRHLFLFTITSLRRSVELAGLDVVDCRTTAHWADIIYLHSWFIRRNGRTLNSGSLILLLLLPLLLLRARLFARRERLDCLTKDVGEELELLARRPA